MSWTIFFAVLLAASMHAGWNTLIKLNRDGTAAITLVMSAGGVFALPLLFVFAAPHGRGIILLALSIPAHILYYIWLNRAYAKGDMGQVYPLARGAAPLLTALISAVFLHEGLSPPAWAAIIVLSSGIMLMALRGGAGRPRIKAVKLALTTSVFITAYTLIDGWGGRLSPSAAGFAAWLMFLETPVILAIAPFWGGGNIYRRMAREWKTGLAGGALATTGFTIVIWAMSQAPVAAIAALRESSILFAMGLSVLVLEEKVSGWRIVSAAFILAGVIGLRLAG